jgi:PAS domain S-box-containing protein
MSTSPGTTEKRSSLTSRDEEQDNAAEVERLVRERTVELREENDALRRENAELRQIETVYASAPVGLCLLGTDTRYLHVNQRFAEMSGFSVEEHIGKRVRDLAPDLADAAEDLARAVVATGKPALDVEVRGETPAHPGVRRYWNESWRPVTDKKGRVIAINIVAEDITERKRVEEALRESERQLQKAQAMAHIGNWVWDLRTDTTVASPEMFRIYGIEAGGGPEVDNDLFMRTVHPDDRRAVEESVCHAAAGEGTLSIDYRIVLPGGEIRYIHSEAMLVKDDTGRPCQVFGTDQDITERKRAEDALRESEERFAAFMDNSPAGAWMKDEQGRHVYLNKILADHFNPRLEDWRGKTDFELWPHSIAEQFWKNDLIVLKEGRVIEVVEETPNPEGDSTYWWNFKFPFQDASGKKYVGGMGIDITDWKRAEAALRESEEKYRNLVELAPEPIAVHRQGKVVYVNPPCVALFGAERKEDLLGKPTLQFVHPDDHEAVRGRIRRMKDKGTTVPLLAEKFVKLDGQVIDVEVVATPIIYENLPSVMVLFRDITERKRTELSLKESEEKIRSILDRSLDALYRRNLLTGRSDYYSDAIEQITGFTVQETLAMTVDEILERVHPDDRPRVMAEKVNAVPTATGGTVDYRFLCKDGTYRWISDRFRIIHDAEGKPLFREGIARDITERKQAEAKFRAVMEKEHLRATELDATLASIASGVIIYDSTGAIVRVNEAVRKMVDRTSISFDPIRFEERQASFGVVRADGTPLPLEATPYHRALRGETVQGEEVMVTRLDREPLWMDTSAAPIRDGSGAIVGAIAILTDITERKRAEEALQRYAEHLGRLHRDLEISNREANLYLDILTHDIGNTENVSNLYADLLIESLDGEASGYVKKLQRSIQKSIEILGTVSTIRRIHRTTTGLKPTDLDAAVRGVMEDYPTSIFLYNGAHHLVQADDLLPVVFNNLIGNAVKFGGPDVEIAIRIEEDDGFVRVSVEDTGPGVPDDDKNEIFHCYEMKKRGVGKGIGLYLVKILVERYGGKIWVEDRVPGYLEEGAAFKFTLTTAT